MKWQQRNARQSDLVKSQSAEPISSSVVLIRQERETGSVAGYYLQAKILVFFFPSQDDVHDVGLVSSRIPFDPSWDKAHYLTFFPSWPALWFDLVVMPSILFLICPAITFLWSGRTCQLRNP